MYEFACEGLSVPEKCELFLKIDFDSFKIFRTDHEMNTMSPEWGFKAGFQYAMHYLEKLSRRRLRVQCFNRRSDQLVGEASVDLQTIACGPANFKLTLKDQTSPEPRGVLKFICVMKMLGDIALVFKDLKLTMQGCPAPARLAISTTLAEEEGSAAAAEVSVPHSQEGAWSGPFCLTVETTLGDLLKTPDCEYVQCQVIDELGVRQGEAQIVFRDSFNPKAETPIEFKVPVVYSYAADGEDKPEPVGAVGELEGVMSYQNLPVYAQMVGGLCIDGQVEGGYWLIEGLPFPHVLTSPPQVWQEPSTGGLEGFSFSVDQQTFGDDESRFDDIDDKTMYEALEKIDMPPPWEKRRERAGERGGRTYFADPRSRRTTWKDPRFLPENWDQRIDPQTGKVYFRYHKTRQTTYVDPRGCPADWEVRLSRNGEVYFAFLPAMQTTFNDPRGLPENFDACLDDIGRMYFKDHATKTTTWNDPRQNQQEVTLTNWRQAQLRRWLKHQVWTELEEISKLRSDLDEREDDDTLDHAGAAAAGSSPGSS